MFLIIYSILISILFCAACIFLFKFSRRLIDMEDKINDLLEVIDKADENIGISLQKPLFFDNPEIRGVINDVKNVREAILDIADAISMPIEYVEEGPQEELNLQPINNNPPMRFR